MAFLEDFEDQILNDLRQKLLQRDGDIPPNGNTQAANVEVESKKSKSKTNNKPPAEKLINNNKTTDDGFKIVSENYLPEDDSDVSDAFDFEESVSEDEGNVSEDGEDGASERGGESEEDEEEVEGRAKGSRTTEDGFKIMSVTDLPEDDSDFSDAFESGQEDGQEGEESSPSADEGSDSDGSPPSASQRRGRKAPARQSSNVTDNTAVQKLKQQLEKVKAKLSSHTISASQRKRCKKVVAKLQDQIKFETEIENNCVQSDEIEDISREPEGEKMNNDLETLKQKYENIQKEMDCDIISKSKKRKLTRVRFRLKTEIDKLEIKNNSNKSLWEVLTLPTTKKERKMFEKNKVKLANRTPFTDEELEEFKKNFSRKFIKGIEAIGKSWLDVETEEQRDRRVLARLPPPEQVAGCVTYWARDAATGQVVRRMDYALHHRREQQAREDRRRARQEKEDKEALEEEEKKKQQELKKSGKSKHTLFMEEMDRKTQEVRDSINRKSFTSKQRVADRISRLGIKTRNKYVNYKDLQMEKKEEKEHKLKEDEDLRNRGLHSRIKKTARKKRKRDANDIAGATSLGGMLRDDSVLLVKKRRIDALNRQT